MRHSIGLLALFMLLLPGAAALAADARVVVVEGSASIAVDPDLAWLSMGIQARDPDVKAASADVARRVAKLLAFTRELGVPDKDVSSAAAEVRPEFDWDNPASRGGKGPRLIGYVVRRQISIRLEDLELIGRLTEGALEAGVNDLSNAIFDTSRRDELEREALTLAVADARLRAAALAGGDEARVGAARRLSAQRSGGPRPQAMMRAAESMSVSADQTYQTGQIRIEARVNAEFDLITD